MISIVSGKMKLLLTASYREPSEHQKELKLGVGIYLIDAIAFIGAPWKSLSRTEEEEAI